jgi:hypothetical protein
MKRVFCAAGLGLLAPFAYILGAEPFEVPGQNSLKEILAGSLALALYLGACQFWIARKGNRAPRVDWPVLLAMAASLVIMGLLIVLVEGGRSWLYSALPMVVSGGVGSFIGALLAARGTVNPTPASAAR